MSYILAPKAVISCNPIKMDQALSNVIQLTN